MSRPNKDIALFFAVSNYDQWGNLQNPIKDAEAIAGDLNKYYAFDTLIVRNPTYDQVIEILNRFASRTYADYSQLFIFFTGHGYLSEAKEGFFVPKDGLRIDQSQRSYLAHNRIAYLINTIPCKNILLGIDACYSGSFIRVASYRKDSINLTNIGKRPGETDLGRKERFVQDMLQYKSRLVITSGGEVPTNDNSQFARQILVALRSRGGYNGILDFYGLVSYLQSARPTPRHGEFGDNEPGGQFLFVFNNAEVNSLPINSIDITIQDDPGLTIGIPDNMVLVRGATFQMGSISNKKDAKPVHAVTVGDFYLGKREVTNAEYCLFLNEKGNQSEGGTEWIKISGSFEQEKCRILQNGKQFSVEAGYDHFPVIYVSWYGAKAYCDWLTEKAGKMNSGVAYRLPTEAEWEYAAGNGSKHTRYSWGAGNPNGRRGGNIADLSAAKILDAASVYRSYNDGFIFCAPVSTYDSNEFGVFDMTGNVREWCNDWYTGDYSESTQGSSQILKKVTRGGSWLTLLKDCEVPSRSSAAQETSTCDIGFRVVLTTNH